MSNLISGKEAKLAWANNKEIEYMPLNKWNLLGGSTPLSIFDRDDVKFRIKPRTITINGIEAPEGMNYAYKDEFNIHFTKLEMGYRDSIIVWQRETLNDKVASAEVARQEFIGAPFSDLPEVNF